MLIKSVTLSILLGLLSCGWEKQTKHWWHTTRVTSSSRSIAESGIPCCLIPTSRQLYSGSIGWKYEWTASDPFVNSGISLYWLAKIGSKIDVRAVEGAKYIDIINISHRKKKGEGNAWWSVKNKNAQIAVLWPRWVGQTEIANLGEKWWHAIVTNCLEWTFSCLNIQT